MVCNSSLFVFPHMPLVITANIVRDFQIDLTQSNNICFILFGIFSGLFLLLFLLDSFKSGLLCLHTATGTALS